MAHVNKTQLNGQFNGFFTKDLSFCYMDNESLSQLESLMEEFFYPNTSNERKRQIEAVLSEFSMSHNSWQLSFVYFERTKNEYTQMFCLTVIETFINQRWHSVPNEVRINFRLSLWKHLLDHHVQLTPPIRNKFCKLIVSIARFDWAYTFPDFMTNVLQLLTWESSQKTAHPSNSILLGLNILSITVEELPSGLNSYHFSSQVELLKLLESNLPNMLRSLTTLLELIISKHINYISATPPPSPTNSPPNTFTNLNKTDDSLNNIFQMSIKKELLNTIPDMDNEFVQITSQIFDCLSRIFAFMPVTYYQNINSTLLSALYVFATFGSVNPSFNSAKLGLISMNCINELISKASAFNSDANEFIYNVFKNTFLILQRIVTNSLEAKNGQDFNKNDIDEDYLKKLIDFLTLFIKGHLGRFEKFISFPTKDFLTLLLQFTTKINHSMECYLMLVESWTVYLEYLENSLSMKHKDKVVTEDNLQIIKEPIFAFLLFVLRSVQYSCNREYLQQIEEESQTEYETYMERSIEVIAKIAEIFPDETINYIDNNYYNEKLHNIHYGLEYLVNNNKPLDPSAFVGHDSSRKLFPIELTQQPLAQLQLAIHDFITALQLCSRFAHFFVDDSFEHHFTRTKLIFAKLCEILHFIEAHHFCDLYRPNSLLCEFILLKAQILATFKAYIVWFQQFSCSRCDKALETNNGAECLTIVFNTCCSIICDTTILDGVGPHCDGEALFSWRKLFHSAALTLNSFSINVRPSFVFRLNSVQRLLDGNVQASVLRLCPVNSTVNTNSTNHVTSPGKTVNTSAMPFFISLTDQILISQAISNFLILPWFSLQNDGQEWERRSVSLNVFVGNFLHLFNKLDMSEISCQTYSLNEAVSSEQQEEIRKCPNVFCRSLYILKKVIKSHSDSPLKSKQLLLMSLNSSLEAFIQLLMHNTLLHSTITGCQITGHILALFIVVFNVLLAQIHIDFVKRTIQTLLQIIHTQDVRSANVNGQPNETLKETSSLRVIIKFLKLLILIIKQTSINSALRSLLPEIIDFTVIHIQNNLISLKSAASVHFRNATGIQYDTYFKLQRIFYQFMYELLLNNARYFFPQSNIANKISFGSSLGSNTSTVPVCKSSSVTDGDHHRFHNIMEIFGQSFMQPENLELFHQNIKSFESLNETIKLYRRPLFKTTFLERFLYLFMQTLLDRSFDLLDECLYSIVYHLAEEHFDTYFEVFVPKFLANIQHLTDQQRMDLMANFKIHSNLASEMQVDLPTFSGKLNRLLCDIRFYHKCNTL